MHVRVLLESYGKGAPQSPNQQELSCLNPQRNSPSVSHSSELINLASYVQTVVKRVMTRSTMREVIDQLRSLRAVLLTKERRSRRSSWCLRMAGVVQLSMPERMAM